MAEDISIPENGNQYENLLVMGPSLGIGIDADIGSESHPSNYSADPRNSHSLKTTNNYTALHNNARNDIPNSDNSTYSHPRPAPSYNNTIINININNNNNNRAPIAEEGNLLSMAQSVRNLGHHVPSMNINFNHQQINALNASLNAAGTMNNTNYAELRTSMFVPDVNASLSNTNGFRNNQHPGFPADFVTLSQNHNNGPFTVTEDNYTTMHRGGHSGERYYGRQFGLTQGSVGDISPGLNVHPSGVEDNKRGNKREITQREVEGRGVPNLPITKRARHSEQHEDLMQAQQQQQPNSGSSSQWGNASGRSYSMFAEIDGRNLSQYQCLARKQIEIFEATLEEAGNNAQGRNRPILPGQVGIRCRYCGKLPPKQRKTGSIYYPNRVRIVIVGIRKFNRTPSSIR